MILTEFAILLMITSVWRANKLAPNKITCDEMVKEIADKLIVYLKEGTVNPESFLEKVDLQINNMEQLLRIHFLLKEQVKDFIEELPWRIRNIKTSTEKIHRQHRNEVRGRINWQETLKSRHNQNYRDSTLFVCEQTDKNFNIRENIVLKKMLSIIYDIIVTDLEGRPENYAWLSDWLGERELAATLENLYLRNIYLKRIDIQETQVTDRMIQFTKDSRSQIYRTAAELLELYRELIVKKGWQDDPAEMINLLENTFIKPEKESVLFELYWVIKLLEHNAERDSCQFELIEKYGSIVARWLEKERKYTLYHDSDGSRDLNWSIKLEEFAQPKNEYLRRRVESRKQARKISSIFDKSLGNNLWGGRPDIVIEVRNREDDLEKVIIGEVKYTGLSSTARSGLRELMDYCQLIRRKNKEGDKEFITHYRKPEIMGLLLTDRLTKSQLAEGQTAEIFGLKIRRGYQGNWISEPVFSREIDI